MFGSPHAVFSGLKLSIGFACLNAAAAALMADCGSTTFWSTLLPAGACACPPTPGAHEAMMTRVTMTTATFNGRVIDTPPCAGAILYQIQVPW